VLATCPKPSSCHHSRQQPSSGVPEALHRQLKARAALAGLPLSDYLIRAARKLVEYPTPEEMRERLKGRAPYRGKIAASDLVRAVRDSR
jgi:hypothetical protein